jgi:hypothetical protein
VLAAHGAGKSVVAPHLRAFLPGSVILDWYAFMDPAPALAGVGIRQAPQTWASYEQLVRTIVDQVWSVSTLLLKRVHTPAAERLAKWRMAPHRLRRFTSAGPGSLHVAIQPKRRKQSPMPPPTER